MSKASYSDFYELVRGVIEDAPISDALLPENMESSASIFLERWNADPGIILGTDAAPVRFSRKAFRGLARVFWDSHKLKREIAFTLLIDEKALHVVSCVCGKTGSEGFCDWEEGNLLKESFARASAERIKIMLGHTHPKCYGAICSDVHLPRINKGNKGPWKDDYWEMWERMTVREGAEYVSRFHVIMSPRENQIGVFELTGEGRVTYHPWEVEA